MMVFDTYKEMKVIAVVALICGFSLGLSVGIMLGWNLK